MHAEVSITYTKNSNHPPRLAVDGQFERAQPSLSLYCAYTDKQPDPWLRIDLYKYVAVAQVHVVNVKSSSSKYFEIEVAMEKKNGKTCGGYHYTEDVLFVNCLSAIFGRYVTVRQPGELVYLYVCEVAVFPTAKGKTSLT